MFYKIKQFISIIILTGFASITLAQQSEQATLEDEIYASLSSQPNIVVSIDPLYEILSSLSHGITRPEIIYRNFNDIDKPLSTMQKQTLQQADIILRVGKGFEPLLDDYLEQQGEVLKKKTITLSNYIPLLDKANLRTEKNPDVIFTDRQATSDLRFWMDPRLVKALVSFIAPRLVLMDPIHQEEYLDNEIILKEQLKKVEKKMLTLFNELSIEQKFLMARFNPYLKNRYISFAEINKMMASYTFDSKVIGCIQNRSFDTIPLNLAYTEKALNSLLHTLELCSQTNVVIR